MRYNAVVSQTDKIKEEIGWLKVVFGALVATDISLVAWLAQNFRTTDFPLIVLAVITVAGTTIAIIGVNHAAFRRMAQLEKLNGVGRRYSSAYLHWWHACRCL